MIRVPRAADGRAKLARQTGVYRILATRGLAVPRDADLARDTGGEIVAGFYRYVPGDAATPARLGRNLARDLGAFLTALHAVPTEPLRELCEVVTDLWADRFRPRWERCRAHLPAVEREWLAEVIARFLESAERSSARGVPVHGDLVAEHVLVAPGGRLAGIIDPSGPWIADPALEFGTLAERFGWTFTDAVLDAYAGPRDPGFAQRARFCADVRPLVAIEAGLRRRDDERVRLGLGRLAERMAEARGAR